MRKLILSAAVALAVLQIQIAIPGSKQGGERSNKAIVTVGTPEAKAFIRKIGRAFRRVGRAIRRGLRKVGRAFRKVGNNIKKGFKKAGKAIKKGFKKVGKAFKKAGTAIKKGFKKAGTAIKKGLKKVGKVLKKVGKAVVDVIAGPIKLIINIVKGLVGFIKLVKKHGFKGALKEVWNRFKRKVKKELDYIKAQFKTVFTGFRKVLVMKSFSLKAIEGFARTVTKTAKNLTSRFLKNVGTPKLFADVLGWIAAAPLYPSTLAAVTPLAAISFGFRALMKFVMPKLILGIGGAFDAAKHSKAGKLFGTIAKGLLKAVGIGGGVLMAFIKNPATKEKVKMVFLKIANVAGKIQQGVQGALKVAEAVRSGNFESIEKAVSSTATIPDKLGPDDMKRMIEGLMDLAKDQIWLLVSKPLRSLMQKAMSALDRLIDIPRNALVAAVGTIPFAGGVLAAALNMGLGFIVDMIKNLIMDGAMKIAETLLTDIWGDIKGSVTAQLMKSGKSKKKAEAFLKLATLVGKVAGDVSSGLKQAAQGIKGTIGGLVSTALDKLLMKGIRNADLRKIISDAVGVVAQELSKGGFKLSSLKASVIKVLQKINTPLSRLVASKITNANLKSIVQKGVSTVIGALSNNAGVGKLMKNPFGFLTQLGQDVLAKVQPELINLLVGKINNPSLKNIVKTALNTLADEVKARGFKALLNFKALFGKLYANLKSPVLNMILAGIKDVDVKAIVSNGLSYVLGKLESDGIANFLKGGGIKKVFVDLLTAIKSPLVNLITKGIASETLRTAAANALNAIIAKVQSGNLAQALNFKKLIADVIRTLKPAIVTFLTGKINDAGLKSALAGSIGPAVDKIVGMVEKGSFKGLIDVLVSAAEPAILKLKAHVTAQIPAPLNAMVGQAFDKVIPMLKTGEGRSKLLREGPKMLWSALTGYLDKLYQQAKTLVKNKVQEVKDTIHNIVGELRGAFQNITATLGQLKNLGNLLKGIRLPSLG